MQFTIWYRRADGAVAQSTGTSIPDLPEGAVAISEQEYLKTVAAYKSKHAEHSAKLVAADKARIDADMQVLLNLGLPEATAKRILRVE